MRWVNTKVVTDILTGEVVSREGYWYDGPWVLAHNQFIPETQHFRFYEDGTESGSSPVQNEDVDATGRDVDSDSQIHLRISIEEVGDGSVAGAATDDYGLEFNINGAGWVTPTTGTTGVQMDSSSALTEDGATTDRATNGLTDGAGTFVASFQKEDDAELTNFQLTADNWTEAVWALLLVSANLNNADSIDFRVTLNGGTPGLTNNVTPNITVTKTVATALKDIVGGTGIVPYVR